MDTSYNRQRKSCIFPVIQLKIITEKLKFAKKNEILGNREKKT